MPLPGYAGAFASRRSPSAAHRVIYRAFCQSDVSSRNAASPFASEAPSDPKDRADWRTTTASRVIDQSNRPGSFAEGVTRSVWGFGLKVIMNSMWGQTEPPVRGRETIRPRGTSRCYPSLVIGRGDAARAVRLRPRRVPRIRQPSRPEWRTATGWRPSVGGAAAPSSGAAPSAPSQQARTWNTRGGPSSSDLMADRLARGGSPRRPTPFVDQSHTSRSRLAALAWLGLRAPRPRNAGCARSRGERPQATHLSCSQPSGARQAAAREYPVDGWANAAVTAPADVAAAGSAR